MTDMSTMTDSDLLAAISAYIRMEKLAKASAEPLRKELLRRQVESGEASFSNDGWVSRIKREAFSLAWLKRQTGYTQEDLPSDCITEKVVADIDWQKVNEWFLDEHGHPLETTYSLTVEQEKVK